MLTTACKQSDTTGTRTIVAADPAVAAISTSSSLAMRMSRPPRAYQV